MDTTSSIYLHMPFPHPCARCTEHTLQPYWSQLPAGGSLCFSLRMVMDFLANTPALVVLYYFPQVASLSRYFFMYSPKRRTYFFIPVRKSTSLLLLHDIICMWFIGKWLWLVFQWTPRKLFHRELQQLPLVQTRSIQGIAFSLASLSHILLWEALEEGRLFSSGWQQSLRNIHNKHLFSSWIVLRLPVLCGWERAGGGAHALLLPHVARTCRYT